MANNVRYNQIFTDRPETHIADGYVSIGVAGAPTFVNQVSGIVPANGIVRNSTGLYTMTLAENWPLLLHVDIKSIIPSSLSPAYVSCQIVSHTVGTGSPPVIVFQFNVAGTPTDLPSGSAFFFLLVLKNLTAGV